MFTFFALFIVLLSQIVNTQKEKPNIIFILADDLGWDDVSFHGSDQIPTPNIDTLAYDGIILNNYYIQPICTPSRSALMTGKHPIHTGMQHSVIYEAAKYGLGLNEKVMPEYFKEMDYRTHIVGKWHLGYFSKEYLPTNRGFDSHYGYYQGCEDYYDHTYMNGKRTKMRWGLDWWNNTKVVKTDFGKYSTEVLTEKAEEIIASHDITKPLFLYLPHQAVHSGNVITPLEAPWKYLKKFDHIKNKQRRLFAGMMSALDDSVGNITKALAKRGILNNTIIAFSTDNGGPAAGFDMNMACNWPLRGVKLGLFEGGVRGVGFLWSPLLKQSGYVSNHMMQIFDWLPTLLSVSGYDMSKLSPHLDGMDFWKTLSTNEFHSPRTLMNHNIDDGQPSFALRVFDMKVVYGRFGLKGWYPPGQHATKKEVVELKREKLGIDRSIDYMMKLAHSFEKNRIINSTSSYAIVRNNDDSGSLSIDIVDILKSLGRNEPKSHPVVIDCGVKPSDADTNCNVTVKPCVYNIVKDPCEYHNLAESRPDILESLLDILASINSTAVTPRNKPNDPAGWPGKHGGIWAPWVDTSINFLKSVSSLL